jgi:hypothetical protein
MIILFVLIAFDVVIITIIITMANWFYSILFLLLFLFDTN